MTAPLPDSPSGLCSHNVTLILSNPCCTHKIFTEGAEVEGGICNFTHRLQFMFINKVRTRPIINPNCIQLIENLVGTFNNLDILVVEFCAWAWLAIMPDAYYVCTKANQTAPKLTSWGEPGHITLNHAWAWNNHTCQTNGIRGSNVSGYDKVRVHPKRSFRECAKAADNQWAHFQLILKRCPYIIF